MTLTSGQMLQDRYRIVSMLGAGGMGAVYQAEDTRLNVLVALKEMVPQPDLDSDSLAQLRQQFRQEAQVLARLKHPHLVRVGDYFVERGSAYLVMDFIQGESLVERVRQQGTLPEQQVVAWGGQLLDALAYCHAQGVIHRDVKPQNVIIKPNGEAALVDFGLVKLWDPNDPRTKTAMQGMGTPEYAPPEQYGVELGHTDVRSDIYSLGATLYHALTGQAPPTATLRMADPERFSPLRSVAPQVSRSTARAVMKALELSRSDRWQCAADMAEALGVSISTPAGEAVVERAEASAAGHTRTSVMGEGALPAGKPSGVPVWGWVLGGVTAFALVIGLVVGLWTVMGNGGAFSMFGSSPTAEKATVTAPGGVEETETPSPSPTPTVPTPTPTPTSSPTPWSSTPEATSTPARTPTLTPIPTETPLPGPTATPELQASAPTLAAPAQGGTYKSPVTFQWTGSLGAGQSYQVTAYHGGSGHTLQSELLTAQSWTADLPGDKFGEWRWYVSVIQNGAEVATSPEWQFWFNPHPGGGGGDDDGSVPTPTR